MKEIAFMIYDPKNPKHSEIVAYVNDRDIALAKQKGYKIKKIEREKGEIMDEIKLTHEQWALITRYIVFTESDRKNKIEEWYSINKEQPSPVAKDALTTWQEFDEELKKLLDTIE